MEIDSKIKIYLSGGHVINDTCSFIALLDCLQDEKENFLKSYKYIIPKKNIIFIETVEGGADLLIK